jgi:hypothetical protein
MRLINTKDLKGIGFIIFGIGYQFFYGFMQQT